ncbi:MAG: hypothetical protein WA625_22335, partial [Pseudolabrys sp.]
LILTAARSLEDMRTVEDWHDSRCQMQTAGHDASSDLIDDLLDNRPEVYQKAKTELLARLANTKKERLIELVAMEAKHSKPASD